MDQQIGDSNISCQYGDVPGNKFKEAVVKPIFFVLVFYLCARLYKFVALAFRKNRKGIIKPSLSADIAFMLQVWLSLEKK